MPHHKSTKKRLKTDAKRRMANRSVKSRCRTLEKKFRSALQSEDREKALEVYRVVQKALDQARGHGVIKKGTAARKKSRLMRDLNRLSA